LKTLASIREDFLWFFHNFSLVNDLLNQSYDNKKVHPYLFVT
jgi:hypothetical protein